MKSSEASAAATVGRYRNGEKGNRQSQFPFSSHRGSGFAASPMTNILTFLPPAASMSPLDGGAARGSGLREASAPLGGGRSAHLDYGFNAVSGMSFGPPYPNGKATEAGGAGVC